MQAKAHELQSRLQSRGPHGAERPCGRPQALPTFSGSSSPRADLESNWLEMDFLIPSVVVTSGFITAYQCLTPHVATT